MVDRCMLLQLVESTDMIEQLRQELDELQDEHRSTENSVSV